MREEAAVNGTGGEHKDDRNAWFRCVPVGASG